MIEEKATFEDLLKNQIMLPIEAEALI